MNASAAVSVLLGLANLAAAALVLASAPRRTAHRVCALLGLGMAGWSAGWLLLSGKGTAPGAGILGRLAWIAVAFLPVAWFHHLGLSLEGQPRRRFAPGYAAAGVVAAAALTPVFSLITGLFVSPARGNLGAFVPLAGLALLVLGSCSFPSIVRGLRAPEPEIRRPARVMALTGLFLALTGLNDLLLFVVSGYHPSEAVRPYAFGFWAPAASLALVLYGVASDQLIELRIALGRWLAELPRSAFFSLVCTFTLFAVHASLPGLLPAPAAIVCIVVILLGQVATGLFSPLSLNQHADRLRSRVYGGRFDYLDKIRALASSVRRQTDLASRLDHVCRELRETLGAGLVEIWYRDANGEPRVVPPRPGLNEINRLSRWDDVVREARRWSDREDLCVIPLQTGAAEPAGYLRLVASGWSLQLNQLDRETILGLAETISHEVEREVIRVSLDLRQANEAKDRFLASINHEVRNPLNGITGLLHLLRQEGLRGRPAYLLETLNACAEQLNATMDNALDFASLTQGRAVARPTRFELGALVRGSVAHLAVAAGDRIQIRLPPEECWLLGDAGKLRQIVSNYVGNALKYGQPSHAELRTQVRAIGAGRLELRIDVLSPSAISPGENPGEWFRPFRRGQRAAETGAPGSGLGLSICQRLAEAMDGFVGADREADQLAFWVAVPVRPLDPPGHSLPAPAQDGQARGKNAGHPFHVLAIEDEAYNRLILGHHLRAWDLETDWAGSGAEAEEKIRERRPDLVIMDWLLGDTDGATLLPRLLAAHPGNPPPVVVLSAYATEEKESQALAVGARRFLSKPLRPDALREALREAIPGLAAPAAGSPSSAEFPVDRGQLEQSLREEWQLALAQWRAQPAEAANHVHRMRGLARYLPPSDLTAALRDIEKTLSDGGDAGQIEAALAATALLMERRASPERQA